MTTPTDEQIREALGLAVTDETSQVAILQDLADVLVRAAFLLQCLAKLRKDEP